MKTKVRIVIIEAENVPADAIGPLIQAAFGLAAPAPKPTTTAVATTKK